MTIYTGGMTESDSMYLQTGYDLYKPDTIQAFGASFQRGFRMGPYAVSARKEEREGPYLQEKEEGVTRQVPGWESEFLKIARRKDMGFTEAPREEYGPITEDVWKESESFREDLKWDESFTPRKARYLAQAKDEENRLNDILDRAEHGAVEFVGEMAGGMLDPLNFASMFVPVVKGSQAASLISRFGKPGGRAITGAIEGVVGASLIEPMVLGNASQEQMDYTAFDSLMNIATGLVLGPVLHTGFGFMGDVLGKARAKTKRTAVDTSVGQLADSRQVDITPVVEADPGLVGTPKMTEARYKAEVKKTQAKLEKVQGEINKINIESKKRMDKWFHGSHIVGPDAEPFKVFHGTENIFDEFKVSKIGSATDAGFHGKGFYFGQTREGAWYGDNIMEAYLDVKNPYYYTTQTTNPDNYMELLAKEGKRLGVDLIEGSPGDITKALKRAGHDGAIIPQDKGNEYLVFDPKQIKSPENKGMWDPEDANIFGKAPEGLEDLEVLKADLEREINMSYDEYVDRLGTDQRATPKTKQETIDSILDENGELKPRKRAWDDQAQVDSVNSKEAGPAQSTDEELKAIAEDTGLIEQDVATRLKSGQIVEDESFEAAMGAIEEAKIDAEKKSSFVDQVIECFLGNGMSLT